VHSLTMPVPNDLYLVKDIHVRFEFLMAMIEKITVVWHVILFSLLGRHQHVR
jgi:hypothetical protein